MLYPQNGRSVLPRRERGKGRQPPSMARPSGSIRPMAARKARESGTIGSISKTEISNLVEKISQDRVCHNQLFAEQQQRNTSPGPKKIEPPCLVGPAEIVRVRGRRACRWRETPRCAHGRTPIGACRARPSKKAVEKASTNPGKGRSLEFQPKSKTESEANASLLGVAVHCIYTSIYIYIYYYIYFADFDASSENGTFFR